MAGSEGAFSICMLMGVLRSSEEMALAAPAMASGPRFLALGRLHLLLRLLNILLALHPLLTSYLALILV